MREIDVDEVLHLFGDTEITVSRGTLGLCLGVLSLRSLQDKEGPGNGRRQAQTRVPE